MILSLDTREIKFQEIFVPYCFLFMGNIHMFSEIDHPTFVLHSLCSKNVNLKYILLTLMYDQLTRTLHLTYYISLFLFYQL